MSVDRAKLGIDLEQLRRCNGCHQSKPLRQYQYCARDRQRSRRRCRTCETLADATRRRAAKAVTHGQ